MKTEGFKDATTIYIYDTVHRWAQRCFSMASCSTGISTVTARNYIIYYLSVFSNYVVATNVITGGIMFSGRGFMSK